MSVQELGDTIRELAATPAGTPLPPHARDVVTALLDALERGEVRAAERGDDGDWRAVPWVKQGILLAFRVGQIVDLSPVTEPRGFSFQIGRAHV